MVARGARPDAENAVAVRVPIKDPTGCDIIERQTRHGWGSGIVARVADDLKTAFPDRKGFSARNVKYLRYFAEHCPNLGFGRQSAAQLPRFHIVTRLTQAQPLEREWYAAHAVAEYQLLTNPSPILSKRTFAASRKSRRNRPIRRRRGNETGSEGE